MPEAPTYTVTWGHADGSETKEDFQAKGWAQAKDYLDQRITASLGPLGPTLYPKDLRPKGGELVNGMARPSIRAPEPGDYWEE